MLDIFGSIAAGIERKSTDASALTWARLWGDNGPMVKSGVSVNLDSTLRTPVALACGRVISQGVAQLPFKPYIVDDKGSRAPAFKHPLYPLLHRLPNDWMTAFEFRETLTLHAVFAGGGFAYIGRVTSGRETGRVVELLPLVPGNVTIRSEGPTVVYDVRDASGLIQTFPRESILHVRGPSWDGVRGLNMIQTARDAIGLAIATEETHARLHSNGAQPGGILSVKGALDPAGRARLKESWQAFQAGVANKFKTAVLDQDATWTPLAMTGVDSEHIATRKFQIEQVCSDFLVFPQMIGHSDKTATFASSEAFFQAHVTHTLDPWLIRWEQAVMRDLLTAKERETMEVEFVREALVRGDIANRFTAYQTALGGARPETAWMLRDEVREREGLNKLGGDAAVLPKPDPVKPGPASTKGDDGPLETKVGRVLSGANETRIRNARDELDTVLSTLPEPQET